MNLAKAELYALKIVEWLAPFCTRIEVAGSIRRLRPECNDVDIVCVPKLQPVADLAGVTGEVRNLAREELIRYVRATPGASWRKGKEPKWDASNLLVALPKCELDLWCANDVNFATRWMCRTGSMEHNIWLAERAQRYGLHWNPYRGLVTAQGELGVHQTEADIYAALDLPFIEPRQRELDFLRSIEKTTNQKPL